MKTILQTQSRFSKSALVRSRGISLVECLIVIGMIVVATSLLLPVVNLTVSRAKTAKCLGNMQSYGVASLAFITDRKGVPAVTEANWHSWLVPNYLPVGLKCPTAKRTTRPSTYAGNSSLGIYFPSLLGIPAPNSRIVLALERDYPDNFYSPTHLNITIFGTTESGYKSDPEANEGKERAPQYHGSRDRRGLHFFFLDGHIQLVFPVDNDFSSGPTFGNATNGGYFYGITQFEKMSRDKLRVQ